MMACVRKPVGFQDHKARLRKAHHAAISTDIFIVHFLETHKTNHCNHIVITTIDSYVLREGGNNGQPMG